MNWITEFLQQQTAVAAGALFRIARVPVTREGIMLSIPGLDIEVASECSSIRSSMMGLVTTPLLAQLFLRSWWRKILWTVYCCRDVWNQTATLFRNDPRQLSSPEVPRGSAPSGVQRT